MNPNLVARIVAVDDSRETTQWLGDRRAHNRNVVVLDTPFQTDQRLEDACHAILDNLGKDPGLSRMRRSPVELASAWLAVDRPTDALVMDAQQWAPRLLRRLVAWLAGHEVRTWLLFTAGNDADLPLRQQRVLAVEEQWPSTVATFGDVQVAFPDRPTTPPCEVRTEFPSVPRVDGLVFRTTARQLLNPVDFALVDGLLRHWVQAYLTDIGALTGADKTEQLRRVLRVSFEQSTHVDDLQIRARAAQIACQRTGWHLSVDVTALVGVGTSYPRPGHAGPEQWWERLDAYRDPDYGTVAALTIAGINPNQIADLTISAVTVEQGHTVTVVVPTDDQARAYVFEWAQGRFIAAMRALRLATGANAGDRLLITHRAAQVDPRHVRNLVNMPAAETGVRVTPVPLRPRLDDKRWLDRHGIGCKKLVYTSTKDT